MQPQLPGTSRGRKSEAVKFLPTLPAVSTGGCPAQIVIHPHHIGYTFYQGFTCAIDQYFSNNILMVIPFGKELLDSLMP